MRKVIGTLLAIALVTGVALVANRPGPAGAQGGGTIEATVTYAGAANVEKLRSTIFQALKAAESS